MELQRWELRVRRRTLNRLVLVDSNGDDVARIDLEGWPGPVRRAHGKSPDGRSWDASASYDEVELKLDGEVVATVKNEILLLGNERLRWHGRPDGSRTGEITREDDGSIVMQVLPSNDNGKLWAAIEVDPRAHDPFALARLASVATARADADTTQVDAPSSPTN